MLAKAIAWIIRHACKERVADEFMKWAIEELAPGADRGVSRSCGLGSAIFRDRPALAGAAGSGVASRRRRRRAHDARCRRGRADRRAGRL